MCSIVGYAGRHAAPKLLEMLRQSQGFDGASSAGIVTVHNGQIYYTKALGNVDNLIRETGALSLPGDVGIGIIGSVSDFYEYDHPIVSKKGSMAIVISGTTRDDRDELSQKRNKIAERLFEKGAPFALISKNTNETNLSLSSGMYVSFGEVFLNLIGDYMSCYRLEPDSALARAASDMYTDMSAMTLHADWEGKIFVNRITRPLSIMTCSDGSYIATTKFAFPQREDMHIMTALPAMRSCIVHSEGYEITPHTIWGKEPEMLTRSDYSLCYEIIYNAIGARRGRVSFEDISRLVYSNACIMKTYDGTVKYAELIHDVLYDLWREGRIKRPGSVTDSKGRFLFEIS